MQSIQTSMSYLLLKFDTPFNRATNFFTSTQGLGVPSCVAPAAASAAWPSSLERFALGLSSARRGTCSGGSGEPRSSWAQRPQSQRPSTRSPRHTEHEHLGQLQNCQ